MSYQQDYQNQGAPRSRGGSRGPKEPVINKGEWTGVVRSRTGSDQDEIRFIQWPNGGGVIHFTLECREPYLDEREGVQKERTDYLPVNARTNSKTISQELLMGIRAGMRVHVVGKVQNETYTSKRTGERRSTLAVNAFVLEILDEPAYGARPIYGPADRYPAAPQQPAQAWGVPQGQYGPYPPQPVYQQPGWPQAQFPPASQYGPQPQSYPPQPQGYQSHPGYQGVPAAQPQSPEYRRTDTGDRRAAARPAEAQAPGTANQDMPDYTEGNPTVRDIKI